MGLFKKAKKAIGKGLKKLANVPFAIAKKSFKELKRAWNTPIGKAIIIAAAIYATGGLLAMSGIGAGAAGATGTGMAASQAFTLQGVAAGYSNAGSALASYFAAAPSGTVASAAPEVAAPIAEATGGTGLLQGSSIGTAPLVGQSSAVGAGVTAAPHAAAPGFFSGDLAKYGLLQVGGNMLQSAFAPTPPDPLRQAQRGNRRNFSVNVSGTPSATLSPIPRPGLLSTGG